MNMKIFLPETPACLAKVFLTSEAVREDYVDGKAGADASSVLLMSCGWSCVAVAAAVAVAVGVAVAVAAAHEVVDASETSSTSCNVN